MCWTKPTQAKVPVKSLRVHEFRVKKKDKKKKKETLLQKTFSFKQSLFLVKSFGMDGLFQNLFVDFAYKFCR